MRNISGGGVLINPKLPNSMKSVARIVHDNIYSQHNDRVNDGHKETGETVIKIE